ncbi:hypothetical protein HYH02_007886 [Chlamydomonas schloesseri]|uniref:Uncharacterized protein n=1 Tax=Chlamydomonas schloesseri TaxID=2026947 RepID=A0A836B462_9CHLO|nr:hypothetical protein HYH02_007886 [Chlamydomonas schloesseri]|eukprot:KAG2447140.1 hypothetical protein HYH02_007886 [Chlamydomonas schloesseri]
MLSLQSSDVARGGGDQSRKWTSLTSLAPRTALAGCGGRASSIVAAARGRSGGSSGSIGDVRDPWREEERRQALLKYVREVQPASVVQFAEQTNPQVVAAMRQTVLNVVGSLPPQYFDVRINTVAESLAQLMLSIMTTGYMLRSAQFRMELQQSLRALPSHSTATASGGGGGAAGAGGVGGGAAVAGGLAAPTVAALSAASSGSLSRASSGSSSSSGSSTASSSDAGDSAAEAAAAEAVAATAMAVGTAFLYDGAGSPYAPGVQKKGVEGEVLRWHLGRGEVERLPVAAYVELLERELADLRAQLGPAAAPPGGFDTSTSTSSGSGSGAGAFGGSSRGSGSGSGVGSGGAGPAFGMPIAMAGGVEVLGPEPAGSGSAFGASSAYPASPSSSSSSAASMDGLVCVSPLPGFGERSGGSSGGGSGGGGGWGLGLGLVASGAGGTGAASAAAPASMGSGGIPLVVGSPLGLPRNELLDYLHGLQASGNGGFKELACSPNTASGEAVKEAMELFVGRLMGSAGGDPAALSSMSSEFSSVELSKVLFWLLAVGYTLKSLEARMDMEDGMGGPGSAAGRGPMGGGPSPPPGGGSGSGGSSGTGGSGGGWGKGGGGSKGNGGKGERKGGFGGLRGLLPGF